MRKTKGQGGSPQATSKANHQRCLLPAALELLRVGNSQPTLPHSRHDRGNSRHSAQHSIQHQCSTAQHLVERPSAGAGLCPDGAVLTMQQGCKMGSESSTAITTAPQHGTAAAAAGAVSAMQALLQEVTTPLLPPAQPALSACPPPKTCSPAKQTVNLKLLGCSSQGAHTHR
jgi:hypothetical protein